MDHNDHVSLLRGGIPSPGGIWADMGAGTGSFTLALAELIGDGAQIYAVDKDRNALNKLEQSMHTRYPDVQLHLHHNDITKPLDLPPLDRLVMANSLHFFRDKERVLALMTSYLAPKGRLILVEYDTDRGNAWVPFPISFAAWDALAGETGFQNTRFLYSRPSRFLERIYSAVSM